MNKKLLVLIALLALILVSSACAPGANSLQNVPSEGGNVAGFWIGLWQGFILLATFIISLFRPDVGIYEVHNDGVWYNLGFVLGALIFFGGPASASRRRG